MLDAGALVYSDLFVLDCSSIQTRGEEPHTDGSHSDMAIRYEKHREQTNELIEDDLM
jgi:hypothetical protein